MKSVVKNIRILSAGMLVGLGVCLLAGCASSSTQDRKVYDRYAELIAARNRAQQSTASESVAPASASRPAAPSADLANRRPIRTEPVANPAPAAAAVAAPVVSAKPAPVPAPPVQVMVPKPVEKMEPKPAEASAPVVQPVPVPPAPKPATVPVPPVPVPPAPVVSRPIPAPAAAPAPIPAPTAAPVPAPPVAAPGPAPVESPVSGASPSIEGAYVLKVGDGIQVYLRGIPMSDAIEVVIDEAGMISLPLIDQVRAAGVTASELERSIRKTYLDQDIYRNITVNVVVPARFYFIQGEIRAPGRYQIVSAIRISQAIAGAGGYTEFASGQVLVKRGGKILLTIRNSRRLERTPEDDILIEPDDIIEVKRSLW